MLICDTHCDTLYKLAVHPEESLDVTMERLKAGGVSLQTLALYVGGDPRPEPVRKLFSGMLRQFDRLKAAGWVQVDDPREAEDGKVKVMLSIEGCEIFGDSLEAIVEWRQRGVRMAAITWNYVNALGTPAKVNTTDGLTPFGRQAVREMVRLGIAPDTSHLNERGFYDILEMGIAPVASHSCCRALCGHARNLTDDQLKALFQAGGYVGLNFYPWFLSDDGQCTLDTLADHLLHMLELGGEGMVGFGSDFDGIEVKVPGLEHPGDLPALFETLERRGITGSVLEGVAGRNLLKYYDRF
ncbi:MAG: dipeptidase [Clostridia bacterium]|nr:dipeptidase [Clostridia bacterium]